jgi:hypothetical protein
LISVAAGGQTEIGGATEIVVSSRFVSVPIAAPSKSFLVGNVLFFLIADWSYFRIGNGLYLAGVVLSGFGFWSFSVVNDKNLFRRNHLLVTKLHF